MRTRRNRKRHYKKYSRKQYGGKKTKTGKKWTTAIDAAQRTLTKTGSLEAARTSLKKQALFNARKLFGSVTSSM
jgi:hypothetical protein